MDGNISEPVNRRELIALVDGVTPISPGEPAAARPSSHDWSPAAMLDRLGGDEELARQLVSLFLAECPRMMAAVRASVSDGSADAIRRAAHAFKGSVGHFTDGAPTTTAFELEQIGRENRVGDAAAVLVRLEQDVAMFIVQLRQFGEASCAS